MLKFLGVGAGFNYKENNTSSYHIYDNGESIIIFDCGFSIFGEIQNQIYFSNIKNVDVIITHFHNDHAGSLGMLLSFLKYRYGICVNLVYPNVKSIKEYLSMSGHGTDSHNVITPKEYNKFDIKEYIQEHVEDLDAYGYMLNLDGTKIFYGGDSKNIRADILEMFLNNEIDILYQDVTLASNPAHMPIEDLAKVIPENLRKKVICLHYSDKEIVKKIFELGFSVPEEYSDIEKLYIDIEKFVPINDQEKEDKVLFLKYLMEHTDLAHRKNPLVHLTTIGIVLNKEMDKLLLTHHNLFNSWTFPGGHADGNYNIKEVSRQEILEETGVKEVSIVSEDIFSIELIDFKPHYKNGKYISPHIHANISYIFVANEEDELFVKPDENSGVEWFNLEELLEVVSEEKMIPYYKKVLVKINELKEKREM